MVVNKELIKAAGFNPTKRTYQISILNICEKIDNQDITLPLYQRDVSWTIKKCIELLNYQLLGPAPVAPISVNEINKIENINVVKQVSFIDREIVNNIKKGQLSIIDGQQRLTTNYKAYRNSDEFRSIVLDLVKGSFTLVDDDIKRYQIPVGMLLNKNDGDFFQYINSSSFLKKPEVMNILILVRNKLRGYSYTVNLAEDLNEDQQIEWFEVLNNAGSRVSRVQMRFSKLKAEGIDIYSQYTVPFKQKIIESGYDKLFRLKETEVSIPIATLNSSYEVISGKEHSMNYTPIPSDTRENQICSLNHEQLIQCFELTLRSLDQAIKYIYNNNLRKPERIDYITYLTGFFVFNKGKDLSNEQVIEINDWYNNVSFTNKSNTQRREIFSNLLDIIR